MNVKLCILIFFMFTCDSLTNLFFLTLRCIYFKHCPFNFYKCFCCCKSLLSFTFTWFFFLNTFLNLFIFIFGRLRFRNTHYIVVILICHTIYMNGLEKHFGHRNSFLILIFSQFTILLGLGFLDYFLDYLQRPPRPRRAAVPVTVSAVIMSRGRSAGVDSDIYGPIPLH